MGTWGWRHLAVARVTTEQDKRKIVLEISAGVHCFTVPGKVWRPDKGVGIYPS